MLEEEEHRLRLEDERASRLRVAAVEVLVHAVVVHDRDVAGFPLITHAVVLFGADAVENVKHGLVHVAVLLRLPARTVLFQVDVEGLTHPILRLHVVLAIGLRTFDEVVLTPAHDARQRAQTLQLFGEVVLTLYAANKNSILVLVIADFRRLFGFHMAPLR